MISWTEYNYSICIFFEKDACITLPIFWAAFVLLLPVLYVPQSGRKLLCLHIFLSCGSCVTSCRTKLWQHLLQLTHSTHAFKVYLGSKKNKTKNVHIQTKKVLLYSHMSENHKDWEKVVNYPVAFVSSTEPHVGQNIRS